MVSYNDGILIINGRAYISIDDQRLISKMVSSADSIYSAQIILRGIKVESKILKAITGKYWIREPYYDLVKQKSYAIDESRKATAC